MPCHLMKLMIFERLEPFAEKIASTVLRRGRSREDSSLSDNSDWQFRCAPLPAGYAGAFCEFTKRKMPIE